MAWKHKKRHILGISKNKNKAEISFKAPAFYNGIDM